MSARHTREIESQPSMEAAPPVDQIAIKATGARPVDRRAPTMREELRESGEIDRGVLTDVVSPRPPSAETPRSPSVDSSRPQAAPKSFRPNEGRPVDSSPPRGRVIEGRPHQPISSKPPGRKGVSSRPPAGKPVSQPAARSESASPSGRPVRSARASIRVDDVGAAVKSVADAIGVAGRQVPKLLRSKAEIAEAPIDHRAGFLLAHIDGVTSVQGLVDIAGMPEKEVHEILERLRRLGIVAIR